MMNTKIDRCYTYLFFKFNFLVLKFFYEFNSCGLHISTPLLQVLDHLHIGNKMIPTNSIINIMFKILSVIHSKHASMVCHKPIARGTLFTFDKQKIFAPFLFSCMELDEKVVSNSSTVCYVWDRCIIVRMFKERSEIKTISVTVSISF